MRQYGGLADPRYAPRLKLMTTMLVGGLAESLASWLDGEIALTPDELIDEAARLCVAGAQVVAAST